MGRAGDYAEYLTWRKEVETRDTGTGEMVPTWTDYGFLWCQIEVNSGRRQTDYGSPQTGADAIIRVRNYPTLSALDRLYSAEWEEEWVIDHIRRGDDELVCDCSKYDADPTRED